MQVDTHYCIYMCDEQPDPSAGSYACVQGYNNDLAGGHEHTL